ncbi:DUF6338 family protein [Escherichia coli]|uniref:DUF6338 family protein n=1 Tax=Escherichia coli TaxID=562 RepID=UPI0028089862|nr:hypothetical protein [Escherichia coli]EIJ2631156.1 hypothetical protein [Escherichia coli]EJW8605358.1 hypothetical protein [Escherichia coli]EKG7048898.1 hypothetical protein [Escherichia coli]ELA5572264.1 hypothetical protein [Escherichia coli]
MDILEKGKLLLFVLFIMPGFISLKIYSLFHPSVDRDTSKVLIDVISYSCINYAFLLVPIYFVETEGVYSKHPFFYYLFYFFVLIILPIALPILLIITRRWQFIRKFLPHPTGRPWDYFFSTNQCCWVIITLKSGKKYGGLYSYNSFASGSPEPEQIYLEKHWALDENGDLDHELIDTLGIVILTNEIESVEFIKVSPLPTE